MLHAYLPHLMAAPTGYPVDARRTAPAPQRDATRGRSLRNVRRRPARGHSEITNRRLVASSVPLDQPPPNDIRRGSSLSIGPTASVPPQRDSASARSLPPLLASPIDFDYERRRSALKIGPDELTVPRPNQLNALAMPTVEPPPFVSEARRATLLIGPVLQATPRLTARRLPAPSRESMSAASSVSWRHGPPRAVSVASAVSLASVASSAESAASYATPVLSGRRSAPVSAPVSAPPSQVPFRPTLRADRPEVVAMATRRPAVVRRIAVSTRPTAVDASASMEPRARRNAAVAPPSAEDTQQVGRSGSVPDPDGTAFLPPDAHIIAVVPMAPPQVPPMHTSPAPPPVSVQPVRLGGAAESTAQPVPESSSVVVNLSLHGVGVSLCPGDRFRFRVAVEGHCCCARLALRRIRVARGGGHTVRARGPDAAAVRALWDAGLRAQLQQALATDVFDSELSTDDSVASCRSCCFGRLNPACALCWLHPQCWGACRLCFFAHLPECAACRTVTSCDLLARYLKLRRRAAWDPDGLCGWLAACCLVPMDWRINAPGARGRVVHLCPEEPLAVPGFRVSAHGRRVALTCTGEGGATATTGGVAGSPAGRPKQG